MAFNHSMKLNTLKKKFPIYSDRLCLSVLGKRDIGWYAEELKKEYFTEFNDNKKILDMTLSETKLKLLSLITTYSMSYKFIYEFRLVIKDRYTKRNIGGITLFPIDVFDNSIEIAYWINPDYQGLGFATEAVNRIILFIFDTFSLKELCSIKLVIQENNIKSIKLAYRCNFIKTNRINGTYGINEVYKIRR